MQRLRSEVAELSATVDGNEVDAVLKDGTRDTGCGLKAFRRDAFLAEWREIVVRDRNHPSIIAWTPFNETGIIPGSMGTSSYIVEGLGNPESFESCSHGAGRAMSRGEARRRFTLADHRAATEGVECRKDGGVIDDLIVYYMDDQWCRMVVNAGTRDKDLDWLRTHASGFAVSVEPRFDLAAGDGAHRSVIADLDGDVQQFRRGNGAARDAVGERFALQVFHHQVIGAVLMPDVIQGADVGVAEAGHGPRLERRDLRRLLAALVGVELGRVAEPAPVRIALAHDHHRVAPAQPPNGVTPSLLP